MAPGPTRKLALGLLTAAALLALGEGAVRALHLEEELPGVLDATESFPPFFEADPMLGWRQRPGALPVDPIRTGWYQQHRLRDPGPAGPPINAHGQRDEAVVLPKPEGQLRVLVLGDSSVWGSGVPWDQTFCTVLERRLDAEHGEDPARRRLDLLNAGVPGYTSYQAIETLRRSLDLDLDGVLVYSMVSDFQPTEGHTDDEVFEAWARRGTGLLSGLASYRLLRARLQPPAAATTASGPRARVSAAGYRANLERLVALAAEHDLRLGFVVPPVRGDVAEHVDPLELDYQVRDAAQAEQLERVLADYRPGTGSPARWPYRLAMGLVADAHDLPLVPGPHLVRQAQAADPARYQGVDQLFVDPVHPSAAGHAVLADGLAPVLEGWLGEG